MLSLSGLVQRSDTVSVVDAHVDPTDPAHL
jgi:hypothetical protein